MCNILVIGSKDGFLCLQHIRKEHTRDIVLFFSVVIASVTIVTAVLYWKNPSYVIDDFSNGDTDEQENNTPVDYLPDSNTTNGTELRILPRLLWLAQPPTEQPPSLKTPVPLVVIHHTATQNCTMQGECIYIVRNIQQYHIESKQWWDIGYNFLIGGDGAVYEGRGWKEEGAHTFGYNYISLGVAFIGTFSSQVPPEDQIVVFNRLIAKGVELGYIKKNYKILGARQLFDTDSPGSVFYEEIQTWPRWSKEP